MPDLVGQQLGNYRLMRLLGRGGFADVYLGEHVHLDTHQAAIKVLHVQLTSEDVQRFREEARILARLVHPKIVRLLDYQIEGTTPFIVMEYAPGGTLRQRYPKGTKLPLDTIISYATQIADALQDAHNEKLVHRDIKPGNILLGRQNEALLGDFGIAVLTHSARSQSLEEVAGTVAYMAPEQLQGRSRRASDQYALGIMVYEWLSGDVPFRGSFLQVANQHLFAPLPPLGEEGSILPQEVEQVVRKALAKDPKKRFPSVQEFAHALVRVLQQTIQRASEPTVKAERSPQAIVRLSPAHLKTKEQWFIKGGIHHSAEQYREAIAAYSFGIELDPACAWAYGRRGQAYVLLGDYQRAIEDFDRALQVDPHLPWVRAEREHAFRQLKRK